MQLVSHYVTYAVMKKVLIVGGGFAGLNAAKGLGNIRDIEVTLVDRKNHHLFQPLLYQVAMAGLSPAEIAAPIRSMLSKYRNIRVLLGQVNSVLLSERKVQTEFGMLSYDYLLLACGAHHAYFGHEEWEEYAPGLKTLAQATEIRRRVLTAFEEAERETDPVTQKRYLTFAIVGGGPTGVELAGAIGEMSRFTLTQEFRNIDPKLTRIILIEAGQRILPSFSEKLAGKATRNLENLGVQVWTSSTVTQVHSDGVEVGDEKISAATVLWAAGVRPSSLSKKLGLELDRQGRIIVDKDLSLRGHSEVFIAGDQAHCRDTNGAPLPGLASVAIQQGRFVAKTVINEINNRPRTIFRYVDKGQMATIGRSKAIAELGWFKFSGFTAWLTWLLVHIYYLTGFKNRLFVLLQWVWAYMTFRRGARLIVRKEWRSYNGGFSPGMQDGQLTALEDSQKRSKVDHA